MWMPGSKSCLGSGFPPCLCKHKGQILARFSAAHLEPEIWQPHEKVGRGMEQSWPVLLMRYSVLFSLLEGGGEIRLSQKFRLTVEKKNLFILSISELPNWKFPCLILSRFLFFVKLISWELPKGQRRLQRETPESYWKLSHCADSAALEIQAVSCEICKRKAEADCVHWVKLVLSAPGVH